MQVLFRLLVDRHGRVDVSMIRIQLSGGKTSSTFGYRWGPARRTTYCSVADRDGLDGGTAPGATALTMPAG